MGTNPDHLKAGFQLMEMLAMGKYGVYVWSSFGLALIVVIVCTVQARRRHASVILDIARRLKRMESAE